jgi:hypothetical protein
MSLLTILYWVILVLAIIGAFVPTENWPFAPRITNGIILVLFIIIGLKMFKTPLQ